MGFQNNALFESSNKKPLIPILPQYGLEGIAMNRKIILGIALFGTAISLSGCGYTPGSRALSGGAIGAGTGAVIGAVTGTGPAGGALIGGALGAVAGAVTNPNTINLGHAP